MSKDNMPGQIDGGNNRLPEVDQELSQVASNPKQSILILVGVIAVFAYLFFNLFINSSDVDKNKDNTPMPDEVAKPIQVAADSDIPSIPTLPAPPRLEDPTPPPPPPSEAEALPMAEEALPSLPSASSEVLPTPEITSTPTLPFGKVRDEDAQKRLEAKRKSALVLVAGTPPAKSAEQLQQEADFSYRGDMNLVLGRGKIIDAIIETALNTDLGGEIRAVITKDIYSEWGKNILLPKGSRVFGNYAVGIEGSYGRISIEWTRVDLTTGYTLNLSGAGVDNVGRKGNQGRVDNKFRERFSNAVLRSAFNVVLAKTLDSLVKPQINSQAAANRNLTATNVKNIANGIFTQPTTPVLTEAQKRVQICAAVLTAIEDKTSATFTQINTACNNLAADATATDLAKLTSLMSTINASSDGLIVNTTANVEQSKAQESTKQAFTDISDTVKKMLEEQEFKPTITLDQGTAVRIYVNKDYKFPKVALGKSRSMK